MALTSWRDKAHGVLHADPPRARELRQNLIFPGRHALMVARAVRMVFSACSPHASVHALRERTAAPLPKNAMLSTGASVYIHGRSHHVHVCAMSLRVPLHAYMDCCAHSMLSS